MTVVGRRWWMGLVVGLVSACQADPVGQRRQGILGGERDIGDPAVVSLMAFDPSGNLTYGCSAVVVSAHVVISASHCFLPANTGPDATFKVYLGDDWNASAELNAQENWRAVIDHQVSPTYAPPTVRTEDIDLVATDRSIPATPIPIEHTSLGPGTVGRSVRLIGFGLVDSNNTSSYGTKNQVTTTISSIDEEYVGVDDQTKTFCEGDSGGAELVTDGNTEYLVGLIAHHERLQGDPLCSGTALGTRLDVYAAAFIDPFIAAHDPAPVEMGGSVMEMNTSHGCAFARGYDGTVVSLVLISLFLILGSLSGRNSRATVTSRRRARSPHPIGGQA